MAAYSHQGKKERRRRRRRRWRKENNIYFSFILKKKTNKCGIISSTKGGWMGEKEFLCLLGWFFMRNKGEMKGMGAYDTGNASKMNQPPSRSSLHSISLSGMYLAKFCYAGL